MPNYKINLSIEEEKGIREYLADGDDPAEVSNMDIANFIQNIVTSTINAPQEAVSDYIKQQINK